MTESSFNKIKSAQPLKIEKIPFSRPSQPSTIVQRTSLSISFNLSFNAIKTVPESNLFINWYVFLSIQHKKKLCFFYLFVLSCCWMAKTRFFNKQKNNFWSFYVPFINFFFLRQNLDEQKSIILEKVNDINILGYLSGLVFSVLGFCGKVFCSKPGCCDCATN